MSIADQLHSAILAALGQVDELGEATLVEQLRGRFQTSRELWAALEELRRAGLIERTGPPARRRLRLLRPAAPQGVAPAVPDAAPAATASPARASSRSPVSPRSLPRTTKHRNLTRIAAAGPKNRPGYLVRLQWGKQRRGRFFADAAYGDPLGSLAAALEWRNEVERELGKPRTNRNAVGAATSNTGVVGVSRTTHGGHAVFQVTWYEEGRQRRRSFNIDRLGEKRALAAAKKLRAEVERARLR